MGMPTPLVIEFRPGGEPMNILWKIAFWCGFVPMVGYLLLFIGWAQTGNTVFLIFEFFVLLLAVFSIPVSVGFLVVYAWRTNNEGRPWQLSTVACAAVILVNIAAVNAWGVANEQFVATQELSVEN